MNRALGENASYPFFIDLRLFTTSLSYIMYRLTFSFLTVHEEHVREATPEERGRHIPYYRHEGRGSKRNRSGKRPMVPGHAEIHARSDERARCYGQTFGDRLLRVRGDLNANRKHGARDEGDQRQSSGRVGMACIMRIFISVCEGCRNSDPVKDLLEAYTAQARATRSSAVGSTPMEDFGA